QADRSVLHGDPRELDPGRNPQLAEDLPQMESDRVHADVFSVGYLLVAQSVRDQLADCSFSLGEARPAHVRPPMSSPMPPPHSCLAQPAPDPCRVPGRTGTFIAVQRVVEAGDRVRL